MSGIYKDPLIQGEQNDRERYTGKDCGRRHAVWRSSGQVGRTRPGTRRRLPLYLRLPDPRCKIYEQPVDFSKCISKRAFSLSS